MVIVDDSYIATNVGSQSSYTGVRFTQAHTTCLCPLQLCTA